MNTSKEYNYVSTVKHFIPKNGPSLVLKGLIRDDGRIVVMSDNGDVKVGDTYDLDDVKIKEFYRVKITNVVVSSSNTDMHPDDKDEAVERVKRIQPFIGCYTYVKKAHYAGGTMVYYSPELKEYLSENEVEILS